MAESQAERISRLLKRFQQRTAKGKKKTGKTGTKGKGKPAGGGSL